MRKEKKILKKLIENEFYKLYSLKHKKRLIKIAKYYNLNDLANEMKNDLELDYRFGNINLDFLTINKK